MTLTPAPPDDDLSGGKLSSEESKRIEHLNELRQQRRQFQKWAFRGMAAIAVVFFASLICAIRYILMPCTLTRLAAGDGHLLFLIGGCLAILTIVPLSLVAGVIRLSEDPEPGKSAVNESLLKMPVLEFLKTIKELFKKDKD